MVRISRALIRLYSKPARSQSWNDRVLILLTEKTEGMIGLEKAEKGTKKGIPYSPESSRGSR
jgi:hypothetical protein